MRGIATIAPETTALKALTHPERLKMLGLLRLEGPQTATSLAKRLGLNTGATSYHLRTLERHGFIEPDQSLGNKRERWWRARHETTSYDASEAQGEALDTGMAIIEAVIAHHARQMRVAHQGFADLPVDWRRAQGFSDYTFALDAAGAKSLLDRLYAVLDETKRTTPPLGTPLPEGTRLFTVQMQSFPAPDPAPPEPAEDKG